MRMVASKNQSVRPPPVLHEDKHKTFKEIGTGSPSKPMVTPPVVSEKRIFYPQSLYDLTVLKVFGEKTFSAASQRGLNYQGVPEREHVLSAADDGGQDHALFHPYQRQPGEVAYPLFRYFGG